MTNTYYTYLIATLLVSNIRVAATSDNSKLSQGQFDVRCAFVGGMCTTENICENGFGGDIIKKRCKVDECCVPQQTYACNESSGVCRFSCDEHAPAKMGSGLCGRSEILCCGKKKISVWRLVLESVGCLTIFILMFRLIWLRYWG